MMCLMLLMKDCLTLQQVQLDRFLAYEHYGAMQAKNLERVNAKIKEKDIKGGDLVLQYNSRLDNTFQKKFQIKWEGPFKVVEAYGNGTYQLADLDDTPHGSRVNGYRLKKYVSRMMIVVADEDQDYTVAVVSPYHEEDYGPALLLLFGDC